MRAFIAGSTLVLALVACQGRTADRPGADVETGAKGADTVVTQQQVQDTAVITHDTSVRTDTTKKGSGVVDRDTVKKP